MYRAYHATRMKSGLVRLQLPATTWDQQPLSAFLADAKLADLKTYSEYRKSSAPRFFFDPSTISQFRSRFQEWDQQNCPQPLADDVRRGFIQFFSHERVEVGSPPRWHADPFTGAEFPADRHWSRIADFGAGDIKLVWETNRFGFVFPLLRTYWRTGDDQHAELFWQLVESWRAANPPETGVNWKCGQEISLRVMAWCFGLYGFANSPATTKTRIAMLAQMIAVSGIRIESNISYALSQQNNHGLSEAMGLWTIGSLFPEFTESARWATLGRRLLESQARELIYDDGAFSQHSMNYHRVMLHDYLWSMRLGDVLERPFSQTLRDRIGRASNFVFQLQDESTGLVPCYGQNDGALILPLSNCDYRDFRPVVQATHFLATGERRLPAGPWDEELFWLFGTAGNPEDDSKSRSAEASPSQDLRTDFDAPNGGYSTLRSQSGFALTRAATFRHRPAQADMLHVDLWWRGLNIAIDPGTYSYNAPPPWNNKLAHTAFHNTVTVDDEDQMERASRFLWLPWLNGKSFGRRVPCRGDVSCWNGQHDGYRRLSDPITHRRGIVRIGSDHWLIVDALAGRQPHSFRLHWLLLDAPHHWDALRNTVNLQTPAGDYRLAAASSAKSQFDVVRAANDSPRGWSSPYYHAREPALSVGLQATAAKIVFATILGPGTQHLILVDNAVQILGSDWNVTASLNLGRTSDEPLIRSVDTGGSLRNSHSSINHQIEQTLTESSQCTSC